MAETVAAVLERAPGEQRVALTPETVRKIRRLGAEVLVEAGAGQRAAISDAAYEEAGAQTVDRATALGRAGLVLAVRGPQADELRPGQILVAQLDALADRPRVEALADRGVTAIAMERMPRITRAQAMDILSSQANLAGYRAVLEAAHLYGRALPMMMTAAGTIPAARVFVMGVGVAGLQAIATARRLGAIVSATDVRPATREQILSLGAKPIFVDPDTVGDEESCAAETAGGYAREMSEAYRTAQAALVSETIARQDIVITTALIPGRPAPQLVSSEQLASMRAGSVVIDLAAAMGGNVEGTVPGETLWHGGVAVMGAVDLPSRMAPDASALFARNLATFVETFWDASAGRLALDRDDEILAATRVAAEGRVLLEG